MGFYTYIDTYYFSVFVLQYLPYHPIYIYSYMKGCYQNVDSSIPVILLNTFEFIYFVLFGAHDPT